VRPVSVTGKRKLGRSALLALVEAGPAPALFSTSQTSLLDISKEINSSLKATAEASTAQQGTRPLPHLDRHIGSRIASLIAQ
jgi:hypothetical protein